LRVHYGIGAECVVMNLDDAKILDTVKVCGMTIYVDSGMVPGEPQIVSPKEARRRCEGG
jgi:hypothetical protein